MTVLHDIADLRHLRGTVVLAVGVFDGVHIGHQRVISAALEQARQAGGTLVVFTFDPHPLRVLRPELAPKLLCSAEHQARLLERYGVQHLLLCRFDQSMAQMPAETFVQTLQQSCDLGAVFVGEDWRFGHQRRGDVALMRQMGVQVVSVPAVTDGDLPVSSTRVRQAVEQGELATAQRLLGRDYTVFGHVVQGNKLARSLGFPTANVDVQNEQLPPIGVYAVRALIGDHWHDSVANLGRRPTVTDSEALSLEVHVFDFQGDLYGQPLEVCFLRRLREEKKFAGLDELKAQIALDCSAARAYLALPTSPGTGP